MVNKYKTLAGTNNGKLDPVVFTIKKNFRGNMGGLSLLLLISGVVIVVTATTAVVATCGFAIAGVGILALAVVMSTKD